MKIGFIDSGLGGVKVISTALKMGLTGNLYLLADLKNNPYGEKGQDYIRKITLENVSYLINLGCDVIIIACNTATSAAIEEVRKRFPTKKIFGIEPAVKAVLNSDKKALVLGTKVTLSGEKISKLISKLNIKNRLVLAPANELVGLIENNASNRVIDNYLDNIFKKYNMCKFSHIILGCTHYPIVSDNIKRISSKYNPNLQIVDGSVGLIKNVLNDVIKSEIIRVNIILTKESRKFKSNAKKILDFPFQILYKK